MPSGCFDSWRLWMNGLPKGPLGPCQPRAEVSFPELGLPPPACLQHSLTFLPFPISLSAWNATKGQGHQLTYLSFQGKFRLLDPHPPQNLLLLQLQKNATVQGPWICYSSLRGAPVAKWDTDHLQCLLACQGLERA